MKKIKLLTPLITLATIGAIAPVTTLASCSKEAKVTKLSVNWYDDGVKTQYYYGEKINTTNWVVTAEYEDNTTKRIDVNQCVITPSLDTELTTNDEYITIKYGGQEAYYPIVVWEDLLNYAWREDVDVPEEGKETISWDEASDKYYQSSNVLANIKDDVFWHLSKYSRVANSIFTIEEFLKDFSPLIQSVITDWIADNLGDTFNYVGYLLTASGRVTNVEIKKYNPTQHIAYINADIIMNLEAKMVDRTTQKGVLLDNGLVTITSAHHLEYIPYYIQWNTKEGWVSYPVAEMINKSGTRKDEHDFKDQWQMTRYWTSDWIDGELTPGHADAGEVKIWDYEHRVDPETEGIAGNPLDFISWGAYYLENYTTK